MGALGRWLRSNGPHGPEKGKATGLIFNGLIALALSLLLWRLTENIWAWLALFLPGTFLILLGWYTLLTSTDR
jgi:hypothetical protein